MLYQGVDLRNRKSRREIARQQGKANQGLFLKLVEMEAEDPEHLAVCDTYSAEATGG